MSDEEEQYNPKVHKNLLNAISNIRKTQHIRKATRSEPKQQTDEFQLVKNTSTVIEYSSTEYDVSEPVVIEDLVKVLNKSEKHLKIGKQLRNVKKSKRPLERPLEKPAADRINRSIAYDNVKAKLSRWDAVVASNRNAETQVFPLKYETVYVQMHNNPKPPERSSKSQLEKDMEATDQKLRELIKVRSGDTTDEKELEKRECELYSQQMSRGELKDLRKEMAYLRMKQSEKSAKARMQNKIKSKRYHKLLKRQKIKEQMKEFEILRKTNPEAALEKLNELEKIRIRERASLRHKNTGTWAKNLQVRAKYDKDVRKDLAEQIKISRELTQKKTEEEDSEDGDDEEDNSMEVGDCDDPFNPWMTMGKVKKDKETMDKDNVNWRKYWLERNINEKLLNEYKRELQDNIKESDEKDRENKQYNVKTLTDDFENVKDKEVIVEKVIKKPKVKKTKCEKSLKIPVKKQKIVYEFGWKVEKLTPEKTRSIDDIFDAHEDLARSKLINKWNVIEKELKSKPSRNANKKLKPKTRKDALKNLNDLTFKNTSLVPLIDEELINNDDNNMNNKENELSSELSKIANRKDEREITETAENKNKAESSLTEINIDPNILPVMKLKQRFFKMDHIDDIDANGAVFEDEDENSDAEEINKQMTISEAFQDDDIIADFATDKSEESKIKNAELNLSMPGWGSWSGPGISEEAKAQRRNARLVLNLAKKEKRKDANKSSLYINEEANKHLRSHLVSDIPFPFTSTADFESNIRAPIGRTFTTETAFRMMTRPSVITRKGQIIEPMDEYELVKSKRKLRHEVDKRIEELQKIKKVD